MACTRKTSPRSLTSTREWEGGFQSMTHLIKAIVEVIIKGDQSPTQGTFTSDGFQSLQGLSSRWVLSVCMQFTKVLQRVFLDTYFICQTICFVQMSCLWAYQHASCQTEPSRTGGDLITAVQTRGMGENHTHIHTYTHRVTPPPCVSIRDLSPEMCYLKQRPPSCCLVIQMQAQPTWMSCAKSLPCLA